MENTHIGGLDLPPTNCMTLGMILLPRLQFPYQVNKIQRRAVRIKWDKTIMKAFYKL